MLIKIWSIINLYFIILVDSYNLCIVGVSSGLGRELAYQAITTKNMSVLGMSSKLYPIYIPFRGDGLDDCLTTKLLKSDKIKYQNYWNDVKADYQHIIFCTGAGSFENDYSDIITDKFINNLSEHCESISLVSATGVNEKNLSLLIKLMKYTSLKDIYRAKTRQEHIINNLNKKNIKKFIYRPKLLSYGNSFFNSITRKELGELILENIINN